MRRDTIQTVAQGLVAVSFLLALVIAIVLIAPMIQTKEVAHTGTVAGKWTTGRFLGGTNFYFVMEDGTERQVTGGQYATHEVGDTFAWTETVYPERYHLAFVLIFGFLVVTILTGGPSRVMKWIERI